MSASQPSPSPVGWDISDHACRHCMGRVLQRANGGLLEQRCAECGQSALGDSHALCWCGVAIKTHGHVFECFKNPTITTATPQEILVRERRVEGR